MTRTTIFNQFAAAANLDRQNDPWLIARNPQGQYANFIITGSDEGMWYAPYVGLEFFGEIKWDSYWEQLTGKKRIEEVRAVRLVNSKKHSGRSVPGRFVTMI